MFRSTLIVGSLNLIGLVLSFLVNMIISAKFGAGYHMDSYAAALTLPNYITTVLTGMLSFTLIPVFSIYKNEDEKEGWEVVNTFINLVLITCIVIVVICIAFAPQIMRIITPGFGSKQIIYCASIFRLYIGIILFTCLNELLASIFYSKGKFAVPLINKLVNPILTISFLFLFGSVLSVKSLVLASVTGAIFQFTLLLITVSKDPNFKYRFNINIHHPGVKRIVKLMIPLLLGSLVYKVLPVFDALILSKLPSGSISSINYANKLQQVIATTITSIFSVQVFSLLSDIAAKKNWIEFKEKMSLFIRMLLFISIPISIIVFLFGDDVVRIVFERGSFTAADTRTVSTCLKLYIYALPAIAIGGIVSQGLYVLQDTKTTTLIGFIETIFYVSTCLLLVYYIGYRAVPCTYMLNFNLSVFILALVLRKKINQGGGKRVIMATVKIVLLALPIGLLAYFINNGDPLCSA